MVKEERAERIAKLLARAGVASRRGVERMIADRRVAVQGRVLDTPACKLADLRQVTVDDKPVAAPGAVRLWLYHKPAGLVTTERDEKGRATVFSALPDDMPRVLSVGRLDLNSEGLLLLTNDGAIKRRLELPSTGWRRKYRVRVKGHPTGAMLNRLRAGITADGKAFRPMAIVLDRQQGANAWLTLSLTEGKNREIRRALEKVGLSVNRLIRISYGPFRLGDIPAGTTKEIAPRILADQLGIPQSRKAGRTGKAGKTPGPNSAESALAPIQPRGPIR